MSLRRLCCLLLTAACAFGAPATTPSAGDWPADQDPAGYPAPSQGELLLIGGDLSNGNHGSGQRLADGTFQHIAGRHYTAGPGWWVLSCRDEDCRIESARLEVDEMPHPTYDGPDVPGQLLRLRSSSPKAAFALRAAADPEPQRQVRNPADPTILLAFRPDPALAASPLQAGEVRTWWYRPSQAPEYGAMAPFAQHLRPPLERQILVAEQQWLTLRQSLPAPDSDDSSVALQIEYNGIRQSLPARYVHIVSETAPVDIGEVLQWVGDLDGDGRPDLLINHSGYYWDLVLWLSSRARPGELVGEAGRFTYAPPDSPGC